MKKAIIVGATSGIGRQLAIILEENNYQVGITGRRAELLEELKALKPGCFIASAFDVTNIQQVPFKLKELADQLGGLDLLFMSSGTGKINPTLKPDIERYTNEVNVAGFTAVADWGFNFFQRQAFGHFAAITSIAGTRGSRQAPAYFASKAYQINYLEGLSQKAKKLKYPIYITDIRPGFVDTAMAAGENMFWMATVEKASKQIFDAIQNKKGVVYITKRWRLVAFILRFLPRFLYKRM
ncbi:short-subunit dehydrogenase [Mucilaginibacter frigoritolerans]|uniref:Short-subunit dehydrogenase n=1 Tax=Mucilaginibacter frigoritolerans TaxID=652788 RepID=A0A562TLA5_9SPHI|nr:SDR family NAD(P)-dependent oxidoreductase [Mucilaginibacter frigoritolerans]TWI94359.1 short-subunit dehydrogenase [Mucilaginibacter frigoritolerans]